MKIHILSDMPRHKNNSILYPVYRWKAAMKHAGLHVKVFYKYEALQQEQGDYAIILSRYFKSWQRITTRTAQSEADVIAKLQLLKKSYSKVVWFDLSDGTGSTDFDIIPYVDLFAKKQLLKDRDYYCQSHGRKSVRIWLRDDNPELKTDYDFYSPCPQADLNKLRLAWNLGMCDYRHFPSKFYVLSNYIFWSQPFKHWDAGRQYDISFRGNTNYEKTNLISFQRNRVLEALKVLKGNFLTGGRVTRKQYLDEVADTKICVSPFGWGEICYRDFEAFLFGCVLVKPEMSYIETFPDIFAENKTYLPLKLDMTDTEEKLQYIIDNYTTLKAIAREGQEQYKKYVTDPAPFIANFKQMLQ
ncbi:MAG TPA: glycosyltransferase [Ferruginibacter sp.]|nr:glycosyltransferase [Ferruginibacter sp.]